jgi:hypothetical protein
MVKPEGYGTNSLAAELRLQWESKISMISAARPAKRMSVDATSCAADSDGSLVERYVRGDTCIALRRNECVVRNYGQDGFIFQARESGSARNVVAADPNGKGGITSAEIRRWCLRRMSSW